MFEEIAAVACAGTPVEVNSREGMYGNPQDAQYNATRSRAPAWVSLVQLLSCHNFNSAFATSRIILPCAILFGRSTTNASLSPYLVTERTLSRKLPPIATKPGPVPSSITTSP